MASATWQWWYLTFPVWGGILCGSVVNWLAGSIPLGISADMFRLDYWSAQQRRRLWVWGAAIFLLGYVIGIRHYLPEAGTALPMPLLLFYVTLFLLITVIDLEHRRVPNQLVGLGVAVALIAAPMQSPTALWSAVIGGCVGYVSFLAIGLLRRGAMGGGDIKLAGFIGAATGFPFVIVALVVGVLAGGVGAALFLLTGRVRRTGTIAYAPYLSFGAIVALLHGAYLLAAYLR